MFSFAAKGDHCDRGACLDISKLAGRIFWMAFAIVASELRCAWFLAVIDPGGEELLWVSAFFCSDDFSDVCCCSPIDKSVDIRNVAK